MNNYKIAIYVLILGCFSLTACGLKRTPTVEGCAENPYPGQYPNPKLEE